MNSKPGTLVGIQMILFFISGISVLAVLLILARWDQIGERELENAFGMGSDAVMVLAFVTVAMIAFYTYVAVTIGRGGYRTRTLVRVVVGVGVTSEVFNILSGEYFPIGLVLMALILVYNESASARKWYKETARSES